MKFCIGPARLIFFFFCISLFTLEAQEGEVFAFKFEKGEQYRIISTVDEYVYFNGALQHRADILNKIAVTIRDTNGEKGTIEAVYQTSEKSYGQNISAYHWTEEYRSEFIQDARGKYTINPDYYMPVSRNIPLFPEYPVRPGDTWIGQGEEVHDIRRDFGIQEAFHIPLSVQYEYLGKEMLDGREYDVFSISYTIFHKSKFSSRSRSGRPYPTLVTGVSKQKFYWDNDAGRPHYSREEFDIIWNISNGDTFEFTGTAEGKIYASPKMDKKSLVSDIKKDLNQKGVTDVVVSEGEKGVTITLEDIQFLPDSAVLISREKVKLDRIGEILSKYPERDILITGHTALAGTPEGRMKLSEERARSVGEYLLSKGVSSPEHLVYRGRGADVPIASNTTEAGKKRNRRVEITILEN